MGTADLPVPEKGLWNADDRIYSFSINASKKERRQQNRLFFYDPA
jgi:hypothetical protein